MHLKMSSAEVVCCKKLPNFTDELSIEANSVDPEQVWVHIVWHRGYLNISTREKQTTCVAFGAFRVNRSIFGQKMKDEFTLRVMK